jgi:hypothetical protein
MKKQQKLFVQKSVITTFSKYISAKSTNDVTSSVNGCND